jgi:hypothetical protein
MDEHVRRALSESTDRVHLVVPPSSEYLRTARLVAADAAVRAGLDCEEIEDFRIAVDELCHLVMSATDHYVDLCVVTVDNRVMAHGHAPSRPGSAPRTPGELSVLILDSTVDYYDVETHDDEINFAVVKHSRHVLADQR